MGEWWIDEVGQNLLESDEAGRPLLPNDYIQDFLTRIRAARDSYLRLYPNLSAEDQERVSPLYKFALTASATTDGKVYSDRIQNNWNRAGIHTTGPRGGTRIGGN